MLSDSVDELEERAIVLSCRVIIHPVRQGFSHTELSTFAFVTKQVDYTQRFLTVLLGYQNQRFMFRI